MLEIVLSIITAASLSVLAIGAGLRWRTVAQRALACTGLLLAGIEIADQVALHGSSDLLLARHVATILESFLPAALLWYSFTFARREPLRLRSRKGMLVAAVTALFPLMVIVFPQQDLFYSPDIQAERVLFLGTAGYWFYLAMVLCSIIALVNLEATFRSSTGQDRWKVKFEFLGMMSILAVLIVYFSQGLLYRTINMDLTPSRSAVLIIASVLILYGRLFRGNGVRVSVSRYVLYRSTTLLIVGSYFIVLGLVGEGMKYFDISFGNDLLIIAAFAGGILLLMLFLSEQVRRKAKVIISKHFFAHKHDYRQTWLALTARLAACRSRQDMESAILSVYQETFGLKGASLYLFNPAKGAYMPATHHSLPSVEAGLAASDGLLSYFRDQNRVWNLFDRKYAPTGEESAFGDSSRARLMVPLICNDQVDGMVVLGGQLAPDAYSYEDFDLMKVIARQSALLLSNLRLSGELSETRELAAVARVSSFVAHDLKNLAHALSLVLDNADIHIGNEEFQRDMLGTIRNTLGHMKRLTQKLKVVPKQNGIHRERCDLRALTVCVVEDLIRTRPGNDLVCSGGPALSIVDRDEMVNVIHNLVQNGIEAAGGQGTVSVETGTDNGRVYVKVSDTGCGMEQDFLQFRLFKPFQTTKENGLGIGLYQCRRIVESLGGAIEVKSEVGKGSDFTVRLPAADPNA